MKSERNIFQDASEYANQSRSSNQDEGSRSKKYPIEEEKSKGENAKILEDLGKGLNSSSSMYDEEVRRYNKADPRQEEEFNREEHLFEFYVDGYSDEKIKEIISIFRNDFKPPKNLWIENMNIQNTDEVNYFNDVFADDDNYSESLENSPELDSSPHNEEIDDIGYQKSEQSQKEKSAKIKEGKKREEKKPKIEIKDIKEKEETKYSDRIKPIEDSANKQINIKNKENRSQHWEEGEKFKSSQKEETKEYEEKPLKSKKNHPHDYKVNKAKDGLNILIPDNNPDAKLDNFEYNSQNEPENKEAYNKTMKIPTNFIENLNGEEENSQDNNISIGKCKDKINKNLKIIQEEKAKLALERHSKKKNTEKKF